MTSRWRRFLDHALPGTRLQDPQASLERELAARIAELGEAREQQAATAEVLKVISTSVADTTPVFETILQSCARLFNVQASVVMLAGDDGRLHMGAIHAHAADSARRRELEVSLERMRSLYPIPLAGSATALAIEAGRVLNFPDVMNGADVPAALRAPAEVAGLNYSLVMAPLMQGEQGIGSIALTRDQLGGFTEKEEALLRSFADQAVIAIQNARLFNETKVALERQTATAEVLAAISGSVADAAPVFEKILESCKRLFSSNEQGVLLVGEDGRIHLGAHHGSARARLQQIFPVAREVGGATSSGESRIAHYKDILNDPDVPAGLRAIAESVGVGTFSQVIAPLLWEGEVIGSLYVIRQPPVGFSDREIGLLRTFADQAVIAIQNARLFNETKEALDQQTATAEVLQVISSSVADAAPVFDKILDSCERLFAATSLGIYLVGDDGLLRKAGFRSSRDKPERTLAGTFPRPLDGTATAIAIRERRVVHYGDVLAAPDAPAPLLRIAAAAGSFSIAFAPMLWEGRGVGAIQVSREPPSPFTDKELSLLKTFADQAVIAIQNARFFAEIQAKSRELEMANKHKSEFLANMSHELRTPLNAIIGFSEVLSEKMFGELNDKQLEYLRDIHGSGHHLLSLINDILDLSKIEAGRMELDLASTSLPMLLDNCTTLLRERASRNGLVLALEVEDGLGEWVADVRKLKQIVVNLLSNAVKFTPAGGRVALRARRLERAVEIAVVDTGVGIAKDQQALVFEEFRQAGGDYLRKSEGTGLGLSLARRFVELHGGTIRVESEPGQGATFAFVLPERVLEAV